MRHIRRQQENRDEFSRKKQRENEIGKKYSEDHAGKRETTESTLTPEKKRGYEENIITEHEKMFSDEGIKIKALIAKCKS